MGDASLGALGWSLRVYATRNFVLTVAEAPTAMGEYLRCVGAALLWPDSGDLLLLSEREADALLQAARAPTGNAMQALSVTARASAPVLLWGITSLGSSSSPAAGGLPSLAVPLGARRIGCSSTPGAAQLASVLLWNGDTTFGASGTPGLKALLCGAGQPETRAAAMSAAELLVGLRGKKERLERSDLEAVALQVAAER
jgi:hypothetical protein